MQRDDTAGFSFYAYDASGTGGVFVGSLTLAKPQPPAGFALGDGSVRRTNS